jgi:hypothetical protein
MLVSHSATSIGFTALQVLKLQSTIEFSAALRSDGVQLIKMSSYWLCTCTHGFKVNASQRHFQDQLYTTWPKKSFRGSLRRVLLQEFMDYCDGTGLYSDENMRLAYWKQRHEELVHDDSVCVRGLPIASPYPLYHPSLFPDLPSPLESFLEFPETPETSGTTPGLTRHIQALF